MQAMAVARKGRELQRYDRNIRLLVGCVPLMPTGKVILISGRRGDLMLSKGGSNRGWESDETEEEGAMRELYEEAGILGDITHRLGSKPFTSQSGKKCRLSMFVLRVNKILETWPEADKRQRLEMSFEDAMVKVIREEHRYFLLAAEPFMRHLERRSKLWRRARTLMMMTAVGLGIVGVLLPLLKHRRHR